MSSSVIYLTGVVALVIGLQESETSEEAPRHVLGCWGKILGVLVGLGVIVYLFSLFAR